MSVITSTTKRKGTPATATLVAQLPVIVVDVSRSGCLLETSRPVAPGTVGTLQLAVASEHYYEDFRVARCTPLSGRGSTYRVGLEFLLTRRIPDASLRHAVTRLVARAPRAGMEAERQAVARPVRRPANRREADRATR